MSITCNNFIMNYWSSSPSWVIIFLTRAVTERQGLGISLGYHEGGPRLLSYETEEKYNQKKSLAVWFPGYSSYLPHNLKSWWQPWMMIWFSFPCYTLIRESSILPLSNWIKQTPWFSAKWSFIQARVPPVRSDM